MLGLGDYESSDEEQVGSRIAPGKVKNDNRGPSTQERKEALQDFTHPTREQIEASGDGSTDGPMVGPAAPSKLQESRNEDMTTPLSPFFTERALVRELTMPLTANLDIPPSPPGSPNPTANKKFKHFLELKGQGVNFNETLADSSSLRNPNLLNKLMEHAGIGDQDQYATALKTDLWDQSRLPRWSFKDELLKASREVERREDERRVRGQRDAIDFVPGSISGVSSRGGTPGGSKGLRVSAAERVMAGLNRENTKSPMVQDQGKRTESDRRSGEDRGHSPRRQKRSRSR